MDDFIRAGHTHHYVGGEGDGGETVLLRIDLRRAGDGVFGTHSSSRAKSP
jgi:hypothetical protein